jgi:hypothetical protein
MQHKSSQRRYNSGLRVIVRSFGDIPHIRKIVSMTDTAVFVCREESYDAILAGERDAPMIGFPLQDVFKYDQPMADVIAAGRRPDWNHLRPLSA